MVHSAGQPATRTLAALDVGGGTEVVPGARRLIRSTLSGLPHWVVDDAELVVTELVTNAVLHGERPAQLRVIDVGGGVRLEMEDSGRAAPILLRHGGDSMTGRGLSLVAALASEWGVRQGATAGKVVWAQLSTAQPQSPAAGVAEQDIEALIDAWGEEDSTLDDRRTVHLGPVPTGLLVAAKTQIDNVVRELTLVRGGAAFAGRSLPPELADLVETVTGDFAEAREQIKRQAAAAASRGDPVTDLQLVLPTPAARSAERYLAALERADRFARSAHLLTLASPRSHRVFRRWYVEEVVAQLRSERSGRPATKPFPEVRAAEVDRLDDVEEVSSRLALLGAVVSDLTGVQSEEEMARAVVSRAVRFPGVATARVYLQGAGPTLRLVAWEGDGPPPPRELPLDADLPVAQAARTGRPLFLRSVQEMHERFPLFDAFSEDRSLHVVPLIAGAQVTGLLGLTFGGGEVAGDSQLAVAASLADALAQGLQRARLAASDQVVRALVDAILPAAPPVIPGVELAARYLTARGDVAGDWWEADVLVDGSVLIGLGDAAGHGLNAVSQMCELRHGARALAAAEASPSALLSHLSRRQSGFEGGFATAVYGRLDVASGRLRWASAGHLPPVLVRGRGGVSTLEAADAPPLGSPPVGPVEDHHLDLEVGDTLVLYSDGVVEQRHWPLDVGIARLVQTVSSHRHVDLQQLADRIVADHCHHPVDDCCLMLVRRVAAG
jgi:serine phosphatase RsbU (regulator of sigma subunit)